MEKTWTEEILGWTAFAFNSYFILYPTFAFYDVVKGKLNFEDSPYNYAAVNYLNCLCWLLYSDLLYSDQIKVINLIGTTINGIFLLIYLYYEIKKYTIDAILNGLILASGTYMIYLSLTVMIEDDTIIGRICSASYCLLFYFPMELIYRVIKQKNFMLIPFCSAWGSMFMSIFWILYGIIITEIYLVIPHCINVILATVEIILFLNYRKKYPINISNEFSSTYEFENPETNEIKEEKHKMKDINEESEPTLQEKPVNILEKENN